MGSMRHSWFLVITAAACLDVACNGGTAKGEPSTARPVAATSTEPHGNHDPKYGGVVLMNGDLHFEVVLAPDGRYQVYFSDAQRAELPASIASSVTVIVTRAGSTPETLPLQIDDSGESWVGRGRPVEDPAHANARVAYTARGEPYWIDLPFTARAGPDEHGGRYQRR